MNNPITLMAIALVFVIVGGIFFLVGLAGTVSALQKIFTWTKADALVIADGSSIAVQYEVEGNIEEAQLIFHTDTCRKGDTVTVYYNPENSQEVFMSMEGVMYYIFTASGLISCFFGFGIFFNRIRNKRRREYLKENGRVVYAELEDVCLNTRVVANGRCPYVINCRWHDASTGTEYTFQSENIWYNPTPILKERRIHTFPVYIDEADPKNYLVSIDELKVEDLI